MMINRLERRLFSLLLVAAVGILSKQVGAAELPAGMVMTVVGTTEPGLEAMIEISAGTAIRLNPAAEITFLHYSRCKLVTVTGGTLIIRNADYTTDGQILKEKAGPCPFIVDKVSGSAAAQVMRGTKNTQPLPRWPIDASIIVRSGDAASTAAVYGGSDLVLQVNNVNGSVIDLQKSTKITPELIYSLRFLDKNGSTLVDFPFVAALPSGGSALIVFRIN